MGTSVQPAALEPERLQFESRVIDLDGQIIELEETYFFAESGGQPADRGRIADTAVVDVRLEDGRTVHELERVPPVEEGDRVTGSIDETFRTYCKRAHTASHVVYGAARTELEGLGYGGFEIGERKVRVDLSADTPIDEDTLIELERLANLAVWESRDVSWYELSAEEAREDEGIAFNVATEEGVFAEAAAVRIVEVAGWDRAACGGTHVRNTAEIGPIRVIDRSNPGEGLTRVEFSVGPSAIAHQATVHGDARAAAPALGVTPGSLATAVADRESAVSDLETRIAKLERRLVSERLDRLCGEVIQMDGLEWVVGEIPPVDGDATVGELRTRVAAGDADVIVAVSGSERSTIAVSASDGADAGELVDAVTSALGGGGGGGHEFAQGGGIPVSPDVVIEHVRDELLGDHAP